jgi:hypothetical protein
MRKLHEERSEIIRKVHFSKDETMTKQEFEDNYDIVYRDSDMIEDLERVFEIFNVDHPETYCGRSLSSGDIVETSEGKFQCMMIGWKKLDY